MKGKASLLTAVVLLTVTNVCSVVEISKVSGALESAETQLKESKAQLASERETEKSLTVKLDALEKQVKTQDKQLQADKKLIQKQQQEIKKAKKSTMAFSHLSSRGASIPSDATIYRMIATAYTISDAGMNGLGITATGTRATPGRTIAVDPNLIPLGSRVEILCPTFPELNGVYVAEDTGGAIHGHHIDVCVSTKSYAAEVGVREIFLAVLPNH